MMLECNDFSKQSVFLSVERHYKQEESCMPKIIEEIEILAPKGRVWKIISDLDNESDFWWGTREVKNLSKEDNTINREIFQNFGNRSILQKVILKPQTEIEIQYVKGITEGVKILRLESLSNNKQKLIAEWNIRFPGFYSLMSSIISRHVRKGTIDALQRIKDVSEGRPLSPRQVAEKRA